MTPSRRGLLAGMALATGLSVAGVALAADAKGKVSKAKAKYQDHPNDIQSCALCTLFVAPDGCNAVDGKVSPDGWCALFALAD